MINRRPSIIKFSRTAHASLGVILVVPLYLLSISGTLVVWFEEFQRWEQPEVTEFSTYTTTQINRAVKQILPKLDIPPETIFIVLPTSAAPRLHVSASQQEWFVDGQGNLETPLATPWTSMLMEFHNHLLLPELVGLIITGSLGAILCTLIINGWLAHPNLIKDLFRLRWHGQPRLRHLDIHNRLGIWGSPFYFMIALTGTFFGLLGPFIAAGAFLWYDNDREALIGQIYGNDPHVSQSATPVNYQVALDALALYEPTAQPIYFMVQRPGQKDQFLEIAATLPGRLIYSEIYRFHSDGRIINHQGLSDGPVGRQIAYSIYRLHFGHFGGVYTKVIYSVFGLALVVICVSGMNSWLLTQQFQHLRHLWLGLTLSVPIGFVLAAIASLYYTPTTPTFLGATTLCILAALILKHLHQVRTLLLGILTVSLIALIASYFLRYELHNWNNAVWSINLTLCLIGVVTGTACIRSTRSQSKLNNSQRIQNN